MNIEDLVKDGFYLQEHKSRELDMALISLRIGFEAYYSTYGEVRRRFFAIKADKGKNGLEKFREEIHLSNYAKTYVETILHFHHFIEISIKEILRQEHELLATVANQKHVIFHKLLKGDEVSVEESGNLYSIAAKEATERIIALIKGERIKNHQVMGFIESNGKFLNQINTLRDRLLHRGTFVLSYTALDIFVGKYVFPFILGLLNLSIYKNNKFQWQPKQPHCKIDPMQEIIDECKTPKPDYKKIAFLKELARAAYVNPLPPQRRGLKGRETIKEVAEKDARKELQDSEAGSAIDILNCPVCGAESLVRYRDTQPDGETEEVSQINCFCCSFWVDSELSNVNLAGVDIQNFWKL